MSSALNVPACLELPFGTALQWLEVGVLIYATLPPPTKKKKELRFIRKQVVPWL